MSDNNNFKPTLEGYKPLRPFNLFMKNNFPFIENTFEALDTYGLLCEIVKFLNTVIENTLTTEENIQILSNAFNQLNDYVSNYFDNLDVQEEINNKLDDMVESGELQEIITAYLNTQAIFCYDNVSGMKDADNLINGSFAKTLGYHSINDSGSSIYKIREITNEDVVDEMTIIALNNSNTLVAEYIIDKNVKPEQFGAYGDGIHDDTIPVQKAFTYENCTFTKTYLLTDTIEIDTIHKVNATASKFIYNENSGYALQIRNMAYSSLDFGTIESTAGGINLISTARTVDRIMYCKFSFMHLKCATKNINVSVSGTGYINEIDLVGGTINSGDYGLYFDINTDSGAGSGCNGWRIKTIGFEGSDTNISYNTDGDGRIYGHDISNIRFIENPSSTVLETNGVIYRCKLESWSFLTLSRLNLTNGTFTDFNFKAPIYDSEGNSLIYTGFYKHGNTTYYYNDRYIKNTLTTNSNVSSGNIYVHKEGNLAIFKFAGVQVTGTTTLTVVDVGDNDICPPAYYGNASGILTSENAQNTAYAFVRENGSIAIKCNDKTVAYTGTIMFYTDVSHSSS